MPFRIGWPELILILVIVLLLFGGRLSKIMGETARGIKIFQRNFKKNKRTQNQAEHKGDDNQNDE